MEPEITDDSAESSTANQGDSTATSPTADKPTAPVKAPLERIRDRAAELAKGDAKAKNVDDKKPAKAVDEKKAGDVANPDGKTDDKKVEGDKETVPLAAFKARIGRETEKRKALQEKHDALAEKVARLEAALSISGEEIARLGNERKQGKPFDEKDEQIRQHELAARARTEAERIKAEQATAREKNGEGESLEATVEDLRPKVETALTGNVLVTRAALFEALRLPANAEREPGVVAAELQAIALEHAKKLLVKERPESPKTVKAKGGGSHAVVHPPNLAGMRARLNELQAQSTS